MRKTGMGRELRKESIACRPCSLNFDDKLLREVPDFCAAHLLRLSKLVYSNFYNDLGTVEIKFPVKFTCFFFRFYFQYLTSLKFWLNWS